MFGISSCRECRRKADIIDDMTFIVCALAVVIAGLIAALVWVLR